MVIDQLIEAHLVGKSLSGWVGGWVTPEREGGHLGLNHSGLLVDGRG